MLKKGHHGNEILDDTKVWKALADPSRRRMLDLLRQQAMTTGSLVEHFEMSRYGVMKHLEVLAEAGLVLVRRQGRERWNHLNAVPIQRIYRRWIEPFAAEPADGLLKLKALAERESTGHEPTEKKSGETNMGQMSDRVMQALDIQQEIEINAPTAKVWSSLTADIASWWPKDFYVGPTPRRFVIEPRVGGRVYEDWGDEQGVLWATVLVFQEGELLQWAGDLSADFGGPARSITSFKLVSEGDKTRVIFRDCPYGALSENAAKSMESGWSWLLQDCFKPFVEDGKHPDRPDSVVAAQK